MYFIQLPMKMDGRWMKYVFHPPAYEDGTDRGFRNVGYSKSDAGELPKRKHIRQSTLYEAFSFS